MLDPRQQRERLHLADALLLVAHDKYTGKPKVKERTIAFGLAAALLAELILEHKRIVLTPGPRCEIRIVRLDTPHDPLAHEVLNELHVNSTQTLLRTWLEYLALTAYERVGNRMSRTVPPVTEPASARVGVLRKQIRVFVPRDAFTPEWPLVQIRNVVIRGAVINEPDLILAGLIKLVGVEKHMEEDWSDRQKRYLNDCIAHLPPSLGSLLAETSATIGAAAMTQSG